MTFSGHVDIETKGVPETYANDLGLLQHYLAGYRAGVQSAVRDTENIKLGTIQRTDIFTLTTTLKEEAFNNGYSEGYAEVINATEKVQFYVGTKLLDEFKSVVDNDAGLIELKDQIHKMGPTN